jgi:hypothetical protein
MRIAFGFHLTGLLFAALGCAAGAQAAPPKSQPFAQFVGKPFSATRAAIVGGGWSPRETRLTTAKGEPERARGEAGKLLEAGYVEVERCTGGERNYCFFNYGRGGKCLRVRTLGVLREADVEPKVHGVGDACPSKQKGVD